MRYSDPTDGVVALAAQVGAPALLLGLAAINALAFALFAIDKRRARRGEWRVRESTLLLTALLGGTAGAWAGRHAFRHKTAKQPFTTALLFITALQMAAVMLFALWRGLG